MNRLLQRFKFFSNSWFDRAERNKHSAKLLNNVLVVLFSLMAIYLGIRFIQGLKIEIPEILLLVIMLFIGISYWILRKGYFYVAAILAISVTFGGMTFISVTSMGIRDAAVLTYLLIIIFSSLLMGRIAALIMTVLSIASVWIMVYFENQGSIVYDPWRIELIARDMSFVILSTFILVVYYDNILNRYIKDISQSRSDYRKINAELTEKNQEIMKINIELTQAMKKARESDQLKTSFLANLSHEIRTPMNGIVGFSELVLLPETTEEEKKQYNEIIANSCRQLLGVVNDIVDISKIESGVLEVHKRRTNLNNILNELYNLHSLAAIEQKINLEMIPGFEDEYAEVITDEVKLQQILNNLLGNALKFTREGDVKFGYIPRDGMIEFYVIDSGIGMEEDQIHKIFDRFTQLDNGLSRKKGGTGLGLSIARAYIEILGGKIWVQSKINEGAEFYFTIPLEKEEASSQVIVEKQEAVDVDQGNIPVLLVEDTESNIMLMKGILSSYQFDLMIATTGEEALEIFDKHRNFQLILMDIKLPGMDGYEVTRRIREKNKEVRIIAQTAYAFQEDREKALQAGCDDLLSKPITRSAIEDVLKKFGLANIQ